MLQVTPTGPWGKDVHPAMPVNTKELLADLHACLAAGADGVHLHPRDDSGRETLEPSVVNGLVSRVRKVAASDGRQVEIGLTTGAWIVPASASSSAPESRTFSRASRPRSPRP